jgi:predicted branched-subunit amino acid permease
MTAPAVPTLREARRRLVVDMLGIMVSSSAFGVVFGLSAAQRGHYSLVETIAMSVILFAGAAQFAGISLVAAGTPWPAIVLLTGLLNVRHLLYSAAIAPWFVTVPRVKRAIAAHLLTDEAFALALAHFRRLGRLDLTGYWIAGFVSTFIPWNIATIAGYLGGGLIDSPERYGIDVVFPAAMAGLAVGLVTGRREVVAVAAAVAISLLVALAWDPRIAVVVGGLLGPLVGLAMPGPPEPQPEAGAEPAPVPFGDLAGVSGTDREATS